MGAENIIVLLVITSTLAEAITREVHIHMCIFPPDECRDCLTAEVGNSSTGSSNFSLLLKFNNGIEAATLDNCETSGSLHRTELQLKFADESTDECNRIDASFVICEKLHLPQKNYNSLRCESNESFVVRENDEFSQCVSLSDKATHQVAIYPVIWIIEDDSPFGLYVTGNEAALNLNATGDTGRYCANTTFPRGHVPTEFFLFTVSIDGPAIIPATEECVLFVLKEDSLWRQCSVKELVNESPFYCQENALTIADSDCFQLDYGNIPRANIALLQLMKYPFLWDFIENDIESFYSFLFSLQNILVQQSNQASTNICPTNCTMRSLCTNNPDCTNSLTLLSGVPHVVAENLTKLEDQYVTISCCNVSCPAPPPSNPMARTAIIGGVMILLIIIVIALGTVIILYYFYHHHKSKTEARHAGQHENEYHGNHNYAHGLPVLSIHYQVSQSQEHSTMIGQKKKNYRENFAGKSIQFSQLDVQEKLGEGEFGRVHKGRLVTIDKQVSTNTLQCSLVAIKSLKSDNATEQEIEDFLAESVIMLDFNHSNVMKLVGVCFDTDDDQPLIILPYMANGDLKSFLKSKRMNDTTNNDEEHFPDGLSEALLIKMCLDIAQGMEYLSRTMFVHRDLAARNCMVDGRLTVCVSDFGLSRDIFYSDYYRLTHTARLPVKWMAPESLQDYIYNEKTDVWSYGVVCWEVFSLGCIPFPGVDNADILEYISKGNRLKQPPLCPINMYDLMCRTWKKAPEERPSFLQLTLWLAELGQDSASHDYYVLEMPSEDREESLSQTPGSDISAPVS